MFARIHFKWLGQVHGSLSGPEAFGKLKPKGVAEPVPGLGFVQFEDYFAGC